MRMPESVRIVEVGPRDGFQNVKKFIDTDIKLEGIRRMAKSGVKEIEITSFVHPKAIPQMSDAKKVAEYCLEKYKSDIKFIALVPNLKGAENAVAAGIHTVTYVISASDIHNKANVNRTLEESCEELKYLISNYPELEVRLDIATAFGCPYKGVVTWEEINRIAGAATEYGVKEIILCDTVGVANPRQVLEICQKVKRQYNVPIGLHLHDTQGMGLANTYSGLMAGIEIFETSSGGLGGCPFAPGAAGNTATEDLINMLHKLGIQTGIDLEIYLEAVRFIKECIEPQLTGHMLKAYDCRTAV